MNGRQLAEQLCLERPEVATLLMSGNILEVLQETAAGYPFLQSEAFNRESLRCHISQVLSSKEK